VTKTITVENAPYDVAVTPDGGYAYVTNLNSATVSVINVAPTLSASPIPFPATSIPTPALTPTTTATAFVGVDGKDLSNSNLPFYQQHLVAIVLAIALAITVVIAVSVKLKDGAQSAERY
jgi:DNA-binding beta-propeller fold protein YncE